MLDFGDNVDIKYRIRRETVFLLMSGLFLGSLTMLNILGVSKIIHFQVFGIPVGLTMGVLPYPITFLCTDFISELYGRRRANLVVWTGLMLNFWVLFILWVGGVLPPVPDFAIDDHGHILPSVGENGKLEDFYVFYKTREMTIATTIASMIAYMAAQFCDVHIFHFLKRITKGKHLWIRNNGSTLISQIVDSIFVILIAHHLSDAFGYKGTDHVGSSLATLIISGYVFKFITASFDTIPFYYGTKFLSNYLLIDPMKGYEDETPVNDRKVEKQSKVFSHDVPEDSKNPQPDDHA